MTIPLIKKTVCTLSVMLLTTSVLAGCGSNSGANGGTASQNPRSLAYDNKQGYPDSQNTLKSVPLSLAAKKLGLKVEQRGDEYLIGHTDVMYRVKAGQTQALSMSHPVILSHAPEARNSDLYFTVKSLGDLLGTQVGWKPYSQEVSFSPFPGRLADDDVIPGPKPDFHIQSTVDADKLISFAKTFLGVKYVFGADDYDKSGTFDCSSFTQYVFQKFNVNLPRLARDQALTGQKVDKGDFKPGDLLFFTVPGRFEDDKIAGHVGIYIGNGKMIHTYGDPGVQISSMDSGYWGNVLLGGRRVI